MTVRESRWAVADRADLIDLRTTRGGVLAAHSSHKADNRFDSGEREKCHTKNKEERKERMSTVAARSIRAAPIS